MKLFIGIGLVVLSLVLGAFQEQVKININSNLSHVPHIMNYDGLTPELRREAVKIRLTAIPYNYYHSHQKIDLLYHLDSKGLYYSKWLLTVVLVFLHFCLGHNIITQLISTEPNLKKAYTYIYVLAFGLAVGAYAIGKLVGLDFYPFSRRVVGFLQSVIPVVFVFFISKLNVHAVK
ncbi:MAG: hypothetical protein AB8B53_14350 [Flavobacteriales bacterium]